jgi:7-carboxy-7-deazaguanine synthase
VKISEIFYSLQGEGALVGVPSVFVRTSGCNLRCVWCDTPYTSWAPEGETWSIDRILETVDSFRATHVVVTGGEPMIALQIGELTNHLRERGLHITIETAGTVNTPVACDLMSISPKLKNSTPLERDGGRWAQQHDRLRWQPSVIKDLITTYSYQLKFVIADPQDLAEVSQIRDSLNVPRSQILLMPEGTSIETIRLRGPWLAEICKEQGYRFSPRLHVDLWGNKRGV